MLTSYQLSRLRNDLRTLAHIEYEEVENELLDHYATLTEQKMADGHDFEHASSYAWAELGAGPGLNTIQRDFEKNIRKQISTRHLEILKSYFRWPTIVTTLLIGVLMYLISPFLADKANLIIIWGCLIIPILLFQYSYYKNREGAGTSKKIIWESLRYRASIPVNVASILLNFPVFLFDENFNKSKFIETHVSISVGLCFIVIIYSLSIVQIYRENFHYKVA